MRSRKLARVLLAPTPTFDEPLKFHKPQILSQIDENLMKTKTIFFLENVAFICGFGFYDV